MLAFVSELKDFDDVLPFPSRLLARLQELIPSDAAAYSELDPLHERSILQVGHLPAGTDRIIWGNDVSLGHAATELWWLVRDTHPLCGYRTTSGDSTTARKVPDFASLASFDGRRSTTPSIERPPTTGSTSASPRRRPGRASSSLSGTSDQTSTSATASSRTCCNRTSPRGPRQRRPQCKRPPP
jgi:hypothetical protein